MTPDQFKCVSEIFLLARQLAAGERAVFLDRECGGDDVVRREVERMLKFDSDESIDSASIQMSGAGLSATHTEDPFPPGMVIGEYTILRTLGAGGMGRVLEVQQEHPRRRVALKLLRQDALSRSMLQRFDHEIRILGDMQHDGIARIHAAGWTDGKPPQPYFTMELIEGEPLTEYARTHRLSTRQRLQLVVAVCDAVQYAHQRGVVHRDLKPANILVGGDGKPKVVDFGIARIADSDMAANTLQTATGQLIGTLPYMSPEQVSGDPASVDSRTDVYAIGVILYELLSGRMPHDLTKRSLPEAARLVQESGITRLGSLDRTFRGDIETIVAKALEKDMARRYASASELAADIRRFLADQPIVARPASAVYHLKKFARRHRAFAAACIVTVFAMTGATVLSSVYAIRADRANEDSRRQADIAAAINRFLNDDLLASVTPSGSRDAGRGRDVLMADVLAEAARRIDAASAPGGLFESKPEVEAAIRLTLGRTLMRLGDIDAAYPHLRRCYELRKSQLGAGHADTLAAATLLGGALYQRAELDQAARLYEGALQDARPALGADHPLVLDCEFGYAVLHWRRQQFEPALSLLNHVYEVRRATLGAGDEQTDAALMNIALIYTQQDRIDEAESISREVLERKRAELGDDHPLTLRVANNLGVILLRTERYREAAEILGDVLNHRQRVLGPDHFETLSTCINLGSVLIGLGRTAEAESIYRDAYNASLARYGQDYVRTLSLEFGLANALCDQRRFAEAEPLYQDVIQRREASIGVLAPQTIRVLVAMFDLRMMEDRMQEAEEILSRPVAALEKAGELANNADCVEPLIACRRKLGMHDSALELARAYASAIETAMGVDSTDAIRVRDLLKEMERSATSQPASDGSSH